MRNILSSKVAATCAAVALSIPGADAAERASLGDVRVVGAAWERWRSARPATLVVPLGWSRTLSRERSRAAGRAEIDPVAGTLAVEIRDLPPGRDFDVWLVDNARGAGRSAAPEAGDVSIRVGTLAAGNRSARLEAAYPGGLPGFDGIVVTPAGGTPERDGVLFGSPGLFQRIELGRTGASLGDLVAAGETLFFEEEFEGNGRTCGTCHPATNNFTIDPEFIAMLPPDDPLFVAETNPALAGLENPVLMRQFGLIVENVDGFDDLENKFTMRGVPHTFAQALSIAPSDFDSSGGGTVPPFERTGWSGDGAPGGGTLREFAMGAVQQHFPKTLDRVEGPDFRFPTDPELDAVEAFMLSLGRQEEMNLSRIVSQDPQVRAGHELFIGLGKCTECHSNGGANADFVDPSGTLNVNFDTGVEDVPHPADPTGEPRPRDGGFGTEPHPLGGFGDGRFNTPSLVEAADTGPFFHHNAFSTIEDAVAFYDSEAFNDSPSGKIVNGIDLTENGIAQIGMFLRVINALENIRSAIDLQERAKPAGDVGRLLDVALSDIGDGIEVLEEKSLHPKSVDHLRSAETFTELAIAAGDMDERNARIDDSLFQLDRARHWIRHLGSRVELIDHPAGKPAGVTPNPGAGAREISFHMGSAGPVAVDLFDVAGRRVASPFAGTLTAGEQTVRWDGRSSSGERVSAGLYFVRLRLPGETRTVRFVVLDR